MFKKRSARAGGARKTTPKVQASNTSAPSLLSLGADDDEARPSRSKAQAQTKKKRKEDPAPAPHLNPRTGAAGLAALRGARAALPAGSGECAARGGRRPSMKRRRSRRGHRRARAQGARRAGSSRGDGGARPPAMSRTSTRESRRRCVMMVGGRASAQDFVPVPGRANHSIAARLRRKKGGAGSRPAPTRVTSTRGGAGRRHGRGAAQGGRFSEDDAELEAHEAEVARRGASTKAVAGRFSKAAPRRPVAIGRPRDGGGAPASSRPREARGAAAELKGRDHAKAEAAWPSARSGRSARRFRPGRAVYRRRRPTRRPRPGHLLT